MAQAPTECPITISEWTSNVDYMLEFFSFIFGLCAGSFLNVCIHRLPAGQSIVQPPSACPQCGSAIRFYDNIPILSYLILGGRCRVCRAAIPLRYPLVELIGGLSGLCSFLKYGPTPAAAVVFVFLCILVTITFIDLDHRIIPDVITLPGIPLAFLGAFALPDVTWLDSLIGLVVGGGSLLLVAWTYYLLTRREGMGGGDIKLLALIGAFVGWKGVFFTIFAASAVGTLAGLLVMIQSRRGMKLAIPFGPFLSIGAVLYLFFGQPIIRWYLHVL